MDLPRRKTREPDDVLNRSNEIEKLRRKKEINARYSRLLLSQTIKQFSKQGHVTIRLKEKFSRNRIEDEKLKINKLTTNLRLTEPKHRTISFWQFPRTLKCEFQIVTNSPRAMKSVRTQTNIPKYHKRLDNTANEPERFNEKILSRKTANEILSSHVGNAMGAVRRCPEIPGKKIGKDRRTPSISYNSERNAIRSKNFWTSYKNFILCNRSIEVRITKLFPLQNVQYTVVFSENIFDPTEIDPPR